MLFCPTQRFLHLCRPGFEDIHIQSNRKFHRVIAKKLANLPQGISISANSVDCFEHRSKVCRNRTGQPQNRGTILSNSRRQQRAAMNIHCIEFIPTAYEFLFYAAAESSIMPSNGPPAD